ncbi:MAG: hypothetical protein AABY58_04285 [Nitrospirota bacterium]|jgi:hypothetical protein
MSITQEKQVKFAICINNDNYAVSLERRKIYQIIPDEEASKHHQLRVIDESGEDYLYPEECFIFIELHGATELAVIKAA